jgi:5-methylcytosine-specific restriction endonuclease McrA
MRRIPHFRSFTGYFDGLTPETLHRFCQTLKEIAEKPEAYFSFEEEGKHDTTDYRYHIARETETLESDSTQPTVLDEFVHEIIFIEWSDAEILVEHGRWTPNIRLRHIGAHLNELVKATFDNELGSCFLTAHFRDEKITVSTLNRLYADLELSEKPKKPSRYIPEALETKLLCDAMHLCNVCRETGIIIHHIVPVEQGGETVEDNLIVLCLNHHHHAHSKSSLAKNLRPEHLREYKKRHLEWVALKGSNLPVENVVGDEL